MVEKKLGYNIRIKAEKVNVEVKNEYLSIHGLKSYFIGMNE